MTAFGIEKLISYEESFYPKARPARCYTTKGRERLASSFMEAFEGIEDRDVLNAYIKMARGGHPFPTIAQIIDAAGWADRVEADRPMKTLSGADIKRMHKSARIPLWEGMKQADIQDGRTVHPDEYYQRKYGY